MFVLYQRTYDNPYDLANVLTSVTPETKSTATAVIQLVIPTEKNPPILLLGGYLEKKNVIKDIKQLSQLWIQSKQVDFVPNLDTHKSFEDYGDGYIQRWRDDTVEKKSILDVYRKDTMVSAGTWGISYFDSVEVKIWKAATFYWEEIKIKDQEKDEPIPSLEEIALPYDAIATPISWEDVMAELRPKLRKRRQSINPLKSHSVPSTPLATSPPR